MQETTQPRARRRHGHSHTPLYFCWRSMRERCRSPSHPKWRYYGGRGIRVCPEWDRDFLAFLRDMGPTYRPGLTLDRIDNNGDYSPENCRWASRQQQNNNNRMNRLVRTPLGTMTLAEVARAIGINYDTIKSRLYRGRPLVRPHEMPSWMARISTPIGQNRDVRFCDSHTRLTARRVFHNVVDSNPTWGSLDIVGRRFLADGIPVIWRRYSFQLHREYGVAVFAQDDDVLNRFIKEARALRAPTRPVVVPVLNPTERDFHWSGDIDYLKRLLERTWWPGWSVSWDGRQLRWAEIGSRNTFRVRTANGLVRLAGTARLPSVPRAAGTTLIPSAAEPISKSVG